MKYLYLYGGAIGDTLYGIHLAQMLSAAEPGAQLFFLSTRPSKIASDLVAPLEYARFVPFSRQSVRSWLRLIELIHSPHYIVAPEPSSLSLWWRIILRVATARKGSIEVRYAFKQLAHRIPPGVHVVAYDPAQDHIFDTVPAILNAWGLKSPKVLPVHLDPGLYMPHAVTRSNNRLAFHFFAPSNKRSMPVGRAREILQAARTLFPQHTFVITADTKHSEEAHRIAEGFPAEVRVDLSLSALVEAIASASVYIGVDTGITHLACTLGTPVVVLGNWSNPCWLPYYAPQAQILFDRRQCLCNGDRSGECFYQVEGSSRYRCMMDIQINAIVRAIARAAALRTPA